MSKNELPEPVALAEADATEGEYSTIFERLAPDESDDEVVGLIAYGLYKRHKRQWIINYRRANGGQPPDEAALKTYHDHYLEDDFRRLRAEAGSMLLNFAEVIVEDRRPKIERDAYLRGLSETEEKIIEKVKNHTKFSTAVQASLLAWLISVLIIIAVILLINYETVVAAGKRALGIS